MDSVARSFPVVSAGCDWLSMSAHSPGNVSALFDWADDVFSREVDCGNEVHPWSTHGFTGSRVGEVAVASSGGTTIVAVSGAAAYAHFPALIGYADNVSRYDGQVTVRAPDGRGAIIGGALSAIKRPVGRRGRKLKWSHRIDSDYGETVYLGSRLSDWYGRVYNKGVQSPSEEYAGCWRYEVELKGELAVYAAQWVSRQVSYFEANSALVAHGYVSRGVTPCYDAGDAAVDMAPCSRQTTDEGRMKYLRLCIRPMVAKLLQRRTREELRRVLGLSEELYLREVYCANSG